uniref:Uncharacterized protein n=1 Tax=Rhizophora mucronata TaxID=61149 RepID=A0A2P2N5P5_RHIMU
MGLMFLPVTFDLPLPSQLQHVDIVPHKATDGIVSVQFSGSSASGNRRYAGVAGVACELIFVALSSKDGLTLCDFLMLLAKYTEANAILDTWR